MPGFDDTEAVAVYPTNPGDTFRVPTVEKANGFDCVMEGEAGVNLISAGSVRPYSATIQIRNLTQFKLVAATAPANASGDIGKNKDWDTNDEKFVFNVAGGSADINAGDFLEILGTINSGQPINDATNDFSYVRSEVFQVI